VEELFSVEGVAFVHDNLWWLAWTPLLAAALAILIGAPVWRWMRLYGVAAKYNTRSEWSGARWRLAELVPAETLARFPGAEVVVPAAGGWGTGLGEALGHLGVSADSILFHGRRWFRDRVFEVPFHEVTNVFIRKHSRLDSLHLVRSGRKCSFFLFKDPVDSTQDLFNLVQQRMIDSRKR